MPKKSSKLSKSAKERVTEEVVAVAQNEEPKETLDVPGADKILKYIQSDEGTFSTACSLLFKWTLALMLRIAWAVLGRTDAVTAVVTGVNKKGISLQINSKHWMTGKGEPNEEILHEFAEELTTLDAISKEVDNVIKHANIAVWPQGPAPFLCVFIWMLLIAGSVSKYKEGSMYFNALKYVASFIFPSHEYGLIALGVLAVSHMFEAIYVWYELKPLKLPFSGTVSWMGVTFVLGYPCTMNALFLKKYWETHNNRILEAKKSN